MTAVSTFENNLLDAITMLVMAPINALYCLVWLIWQAVALLLPYRRYIACAVGVWAFLALCVACPLLPVGLGVTAAVGWVSYPRAR